MIRLRGGDRGSGFYATTLSTALCIAALLPSGSWLLPPQYLLPVLLFVLVGKHPYARARGSDQETALAEPRRLHPKRQRRRRSRCSFVRHAPFLFWPLVGPSVPPEPLEAVRREGGVAHGRGDRRWPR